MILLLFFLYSISFKLTIRFHQIQRLVLYIIIIFEEHIGIHHSLKAIQSYEDVTFFVEIQFGNYFLKKSILSIVSNFS